MSKVVRVSDEAYRELCNRSESIKKEIDKAVLGSETLDEDDVREIVRDEVVLEALK